MADQAPQVATATATPAPVASIAPAAQAATPDIQVPAGFKLVKDDDNPEPQQQAEPVDGAMAAAHAPVGVQAPRMEAAKDRPVSLQSVSQMLASIAVEHGTRSGRMAAALSTVAAAATLDITTPDSFEGKIWQGREYNRRYIPLTDEEALTALKYRGWAWKAGMKPVMSAWAGFPNEPGSNAIEVEERTFEPDTYGNAWVMDRKHRDFTDPEFWSEFFIATSTSYSEETDQAHLAALVAGATEVELDIADLPADVPQGLWQLIKGIRTVLPKGLPTFGIVDFDLWEEIIYTPQDKVLPYLQLAMGVEDGKALNFQFIPSDDAALAGASLVGVKQAAKHRELPGASPIRVDAEVISKGGIEQGVFGYAGTAIREPGALALVTAVTVP
jgi:hypothetical protein